MIILQELEYYHYPQLFCIIHNIEKKYYPGEAFHKHIYQLMKILQENNTLFPTKKRVRVNLPLFQKWRTENSDLWPQQYGDS